MPRGRDQTGFTLIELLTVMAIIAILATLMLTAVSSAKKASHRARCMSNLRQVSLALNMYIDDFEKRSPDLTRLTSSRYLSDRQVLLCPSDRTSGWGNLVNPGPLTAPTTDRATFVAGETNLDTSLVPFSYLNPLPWEDWAWARLARLGNQVGVAVCQLHGLGKPNLDMPSYKDYQGVILRAQRDGAVVKREVYWETTAVSRGSTTEPPGTLATDSTTVGSPADPSGLLPTTDGGEKNGNNYDYPWKLYTDEPNP